MEESGADEVIDKVVVTEALRVEGLLAPAKTFQEAAILAEVLEESMLLQKLRNTFSIFAPSFVYFSFSFFWT